jgi:hypothetical protein
MSLNNQHQASTINVKARMIFTLWDDIVPSDALSNKLQHDKKLVLGGIQIPLVNSPAFIFFAFKKACEYISE